MAFGFKFWHIPEHRVFHYEPRYYDERKERLKELYAKYGKEYPGDDKVSAQQAADDLKDVATYGEVQEVMEAESSKAASRSGAYVPGQYIRSAYRKGNVERESKTSSPLRTIVTAVTILAAIAVAYYLSQGLVQLFR